MNTMMMSIVLVSVSLASVGCATQETVQLRSQVQAQNVEITTLQGELAKAQATNAAGNVVEATGQAYDAASAAWSWTAAHLSNAYHTTADKAHACFDGQKKPETFEEAKTLALRCWQAE